MELTKPAPRVEQLWSQHSLLMLIAGAVATITVLHYLIGAHLLEYHTVYRSLSYLPVAGAAVAFGLRGGLITAATVIALYLPNVLDMGEMMPGGLIDNLLEMPVFLLVGADNEQLRQALVNLLLNAVQASPRGGEVRLAATARWQSEYQGRTYFYCAPGCKRAFEREHEAYLS